jgi:mono/diheme cytochrome c family protein
MDYPMSCPTPVPSYAAEVQAIFQAKCATCHAPGGQRSESPLTTWLQIQSRLSTVVQWTNDCRMPPVGAPALTSDERKAMLGWFVCNAPNN